MDRRTYLGVAGTAFLAGCSSDGGTETLDQQDGTDTDPPETDTQAGTEANGDETESPSATEHETETETATPESEGSPEGTAEVAIQSSELSVEETSYSTDVMVIAEVENTGQAASGQIEVTARFYDGDGNMVDNTNGYLQTLGAGETWRAHVQYLGSSGDKIEDYEFEGEFSESPPNFNPEGVSVTGSEASTDGRDVTVSGTIANETGGELSYLQATTKFYLDESTVLGTEWTNVNDVPAGESWAFEMSYFAPTEELAGDISSHEVLPSTSPF